MRGIDNHTRVPGERRFGFVPNARKRLAVWRVDLIHLLFSYNYFCNPGDELMRFINVAGFYKSDNMPGANPEPGSIRVIVWQPTQKVFKRYQLHRIGRINYPGGHWFGHTRFFHYFEYALRLSGFRQAPGDCEQVPIAAQLVQPVAGNKITQVRPP